MALLSLIPGAMVSSSPCEVSVRIGWVPWENENGDMTIGAGDGPSVSGLMLLPAIAAFMRNGMAPPEFPWTAMVAP